MLISKTKPLASMMILLALAACGGGGGGTGGGGVTVTPQASTGFAQSGDAIRGNVTFTPNNAGRLVKTNGTLSPGSIPIEVRFLSTGVRNNNTTTFPEGTIRVVIDGQTKSLLRNSSTSNFYVSYTGGTLDYDARYEVTGEVDNADGTIVQAGLLEFINSASVSSSGHIVFGFDTNPTTIAAETGTATYTGTIRANGYQGNNVSSASGNVTLNADFTGDTVSGNFNLSTLNGMTGAESYTMNTGDISGNGFDGTISVVGSLQSGQTLQSATYDGNFYGADAEAVGGTIFMTIIDGMETPIYIQGAFVAD